MDDEHVFLFKNVRNNNPLNENDISRILVDFGKKYNLNTNIRSLRHSFSTMLLKNAPRKSKLKSIAKAMGTSQDMVMTIYRDENNRLKN